MSNENNGQHKPNIHTLAMVVRVDPTSGDFAVDPKVVPGEEPVNYVLWCLDVMRAQLTRQALWVMEGLASSDLTVRNEAWKAIRPAVADDGTDQSKTNLAYGDIMCSIDGKGDQPATIVEPSDA